MAESILLLIKERFTNDFVTELLTNFQGVKVYLDKRDLGDQIPTAIIVSITSVTTDLLQRYHKSNIYILPTPTKLFDFSKPCVLKCVVEEGKKRLPVMIGMYKDIKGEWTINKSALRTYLKILFPRNGNDKL